MNCVKCNLDWTCPHTKKVGICCAACEAGGTCPDACQNSPDHCLMVRELTPRELANELKIRHVRNMPEFRKIEETGQPVGMFYNSNDFGSRAIDNRTGHPVRSEEFDTWEDAILWLAARVDADRERSSEC